MARSKTITTAELHALCDALGIYNASALARALHVTARQGGRWWNGEVAMPWSAVTLLRLARKLKIAPDRLDAVANQ